MGKNLTNNEEAYIHPLAMALMVLLFIFLIATIFPPVKTTIIDILHAIRM